MDSQAPRQWGVMKPLSSAFPNDKELALNDALVEELKRQNNFEASAETEKRSQVLQALQKVTVEFVRHVGEKKGLPQTMLNEAGGKVATFGSFKLGVFGPGSDIDTLVVAPKHVSRDDFFQYFPALLEKMSPPGAVEDLKQVPDAHVPIIKFEYSGISIDLLFARLLMSSVPFSLDMRDDNLLRGLDEVDTRSLNGTRVSDEIISLVPQEKTFRLTLRAIKLWAQRRAIYANVMGFPGGVAWAMMVAFVCQLYPHACASVVVSKFFNVMLLWKWPDPIRLRETVLNIPGLSARVWNVKHNRSDNRHIMPVITPAYPAMCATHNITQSTQQVIIAEWRRAKEMAQSIHDGKHHWIDLFQKHTFFTKDYKHYISIVSASKTKEAQLIWSGLVASKVRRLVASIEESQPGISIARPFTKEFDRVHHCQNEEQVDKVLHGSLDYLVSDSKNKETKDLANDVLHVAAAEGNAENIEMPKVDEVRLANADGSTTIYTTNYYIGIELADGSKSLDISFSSSQFQRQCFDWPQYNADLNSLRVIHTRNYDLPADVFENGETRPVRAPKQSKIRKNGDAASKKRSFADSNLEAGNDASIKRRVSSNNEHSSAVKG